MKRYISFSILISVAVFFLALGFFLATGFDLPANGYADNQPNAASTASYPYLNPDIESPFVRVVSHVRESVVNITAEGESQASNPLRSFPFEFFYGPDFQAPEPRKSVSRGTGFFFKQEGNKAYLITNNHVIESADKITISLSDKTDLEATVIGADAKTDLAVLMVETDAQMHLANLGDSDAIKVGSWAIAIGNPFQEGLERSVTVGVISAKGRSNLNFGGERPVYQDYIQTDASINPGNSGGPLVNIHGQVIGVNSAIASPSGGNVGIGFAIPINLAKHVVDDLLAYGKVRRAYLGIVPQAIDFELKESMNLPDANGVLVARVQPNTPAEAAGLENGDIILEFDGKPVTSLNKFRILVAETEIGKRVSIKILRNGKEKMLNATLSEYPEDSIASNTHPQKSQKWLGISVSEITAELMQKFDLDDNRGVVITQIEPNSPAGNSKLRVGDIILEINSEIVSNKNDYDELSSRFSERGK